MRLFALLLVCFAFCLAQELPPGPGPASDPSPERRVDLNPILGGSSNFRDADMAVTPDGEVYFAGVVTGVPDEVTATLTAGQPDDQSILIVKMNAALDRVLYKAILGGSGTDLLRSIAIADTGELYLTGITGSEDFPATVDLAQPQFRSGRRAFVVKLNAAGDEILYGTLLGGGIQTETIVVDASGAAHVGGSAERSALPTTPGVLHPFPRDLEGEAFLAKLDPSGAAFESATGVDLSSVNDLALLPDGRILLAGPQALKIVDQSVSTELASRSIEVSAAPSVAADDLGNLYVAGATGLGMISVYKFSPDAEELLFDRSFPGLDFRALIPADAGSVLLLHALEPNFPTLRTARPCLGNLPPPDGYAGLPSARRVQDGARSAFGADGDALYRTFDPPTEAAVASPIDDTVLALRLVHGWSPEATSPERRFELVRIHPSLVEHDRPTAGCIGHGGTYDPLPLSPGALMVLYGSGLGPQAGALYDSAAESVPLSLAGTTATVDGRPAPVVYAADDQINFLTPWQIRTDGAMVPVCARRDSEETCLQAATAPVAPGIVTTTTPPAPGIAPTRRSLIFNQDGTINGVEAPAAWGSILTLYVVGAGKPQGPLADGAFQGAVLRPLTTPVTASFLALDCRDCPLRFVDAEVVEAGSAPYHLLGVARFRVRVPEEQTAGTLYLRFTLGDREFVAEGQVSVRNP